MAGWIYSPFPPPRHRGLALSLSSRTQVLAGVTSLQVRCDLPLPRPPGLRVVNSPRRPHPGHPPLLWAFLKPRRAVRSPFRSHWL